MKLAIVSDAWTPQVNGVVRTLSMVRREVRRKGHKVYMITPDQFASVPCPTYPEIRLALMPGLKLPALLSRIAPDALHIATEGPLGMAARRWCLNRGWQFTTAYHTNFPEYINLRTGVPESWLYRWVRRFHAPASAVMVATPTVRKQLADRGFDKLVPWTRGVDTTLFRPRQDTLLDHLPRPILLSVGRVAVEKNIEAFLAMDTPGSKVVIGNGPALAALRQRYPDVHFLGKKTGDDLARHYAAADAFVFPSLTDTFGLVMLEALASGTPVAAYPVQGPLDVVGADGRGTGPAAGQLIAGVSEDLATAVKTALTCDRQDCRRYAESFSWSACADQFLANLNPCLGDQEALAPV